MEIFVYLLFYVFSLFILIGKWFRNTQHCLCLLFFKKRTSPQTSISLSSFSSSSFLFSLFLSFFLCTWTNECFMLHRYLWYYGLVIYVIIIDAYNHEQWHGMDVFWNIRSIIYFLGDFFFLCGIKRRSKDCEGSLNLNY